MFDQIDHAVLMERIRLRISDKRVLALVKAFLKAGVMHHGLFKDSFTGAPQGAILSPLLTNIALTALDEHFHTQWHTLMGTDYQRTKRRRAGQGNWRLVRYCDDFVVMVFGTAEQAGMLREQIAEVLARLGLRLQRTRPVWSTLTMGSTSSASTSAASGNAARTSSSSTPDRPAKPSRRSRTGSRSGPTGTPSTRVWARSWRA
ncbi:reverse transcriptase/maturase family protein [Nonomuraea sp. NPDC003201]